MLVHAAGLSAREVQYGTYAVVLAAKDEPELERIAGQLNNVALPHVAYREPDYDNELMAIGVCPVRTRSSAKRILSRLPLLWKNEEGQRP